MVLVYSTTKGMAGLAMALAHSRGLFDYDERVSTYWPEFAQQGKGQITVRQLLSHQAGLFALDERRSGASSRIPTDWRSFSRGRSRLGRQARVRPTTASRSAFTRASCCAGSIPSTEPWAGSSRRSSPLRWDSTSTSGCRRRSRTPDWRRSTASGWRPRSSAAPFARARAFALPFSFALAVMNPRSRFRRA